MAKIRMEVESVAKHSGMVKSARSPSKEKVIARGLGFNDVETAEWTAPIGTWSIGDLVDVTVPDPGELARPRGSAS